jgi:hypothetical protein
MDSRVYALEQRAVVVEESRLPPPVLTYLTDRRLWRLERHYDYRDVEGARDIRVPVGFLFDLSSVPRPLWWLIAPFDLSIVAPLIHDFLYRYGGSPPGNAVTPPHAYSRAEADRLFRTIMEQEGVARWRRVAAYAAVRAFGGGGWRK